MSTCSYELYAIKYAESMAPHGTRFYGNDPHDAPTPMDFFVWVAVSPVRTVAIDCGFTAETAARRGRRFLHTPAEGLRQLGIASETIRHVILTHFHNDHIGNVADFPNASFVVQDREMAFWTGRYASKGGFLWVVEPEDILELVRQNFAGRVRFVDGTAEIVPRGQVVLASDAAHYYANIEEDRPFRIVSDLPQMYDAFETIRTLADSPDHIIPGHDPLVLTRYPAVPGLEGITVRLA
jgi:glyoxylase-like metal-dependent hydrolase (beta-lactamase superfamily II)